MSSVEDILATAAEQGLEEGLRRFYGFYEGQVTDNKDPMDAGRVRVLMTSLGEEDPAETWIWPVFTMAGRDRGHYWPPEIGDLVRVMFWAGDLSNPQGYVPGWFTDKALPAEFRPKKDHVPATRGFVTRMGHSLVVSEEEGEEFVRLLWHKPSADDPAKKDPTKSADRAQGKLSWFQLTKDGGMQIVLNSGEASLSYQTKEGDGPQWLLSDPLGNTITLDDEGVKITDLKGNWITLANGALSVAVDGDLSFTGKSANFSTAGVSLGMPAVMSAVLGEILLLWLATHVHTTTVPGSPTTPPMVPPPPAILSKSVKLKP